MAVARALDVRNDAAAWRRLHRNGMRQDVSWERSARTYRTAYDALLSTPASA
jgi:glycogen synthase